MTDSMKLFLFVCEEGPKSASTPIRGVVYQSMRKSGDRRLWLEPVTVVDLKCAVELQGLTREMLNDFYVTAGMEDGSLKKRFYNSGDNAVYFTVHDPEKETPMVTAYRRYAINDFRKAVNICEVDGRYEVTVRKDAPDAVNGELIETIQRLLNFAKMVVDEGRPNRIGQWGGRKTRIKWIRWVSSRVDRILEDCVLDKTVDEPQAKSSSLSITKQAGTMEENPTESVPATTEPSTDARHIREGIDKLSEKLEQLRSGKESETEGLARSSPDTPVMVSTDKPVLDSSNEYDLKDAPAILMAASASYGGETLTMEEAEIREGQTVDMRVTEYTETALDQQAKARDPILAAIREHTETSKKILAAVNKNTATNKQGFQSLKPNNHQSLIELVQTLPPLRFEREDENWVTAKAVTKLTGESMTDLNMQRRKQRGGENTLFEGLEYGRDAKGRIWCKVPKGRKVFYLKNSL